jgi:lipid-A-disaccharide synthase
VIIGVDYGGFNLRLGHAIKEHVRSNPFARWNPKLIQFVSPQVWASRPGRAQLLAEDYDLLLSIFPFEKDWYAKRVPKLRVEYVGHPMIGRYPKADGGSRKAGETAKILLLPGSRKSELQRHLSPMLHAAQMLSAENIVQFKMVLPHENLSKLLAGRLAELLPKLETPILLNWRDPSQWLMNAQALAAIALPNLEIQIGNLPQALAEADVAISKTGTVTMECALFGVPAVTLYKTSWLTYQIARRVVTVKSLTMPNLLAGEEVYPEFIQNAATPVNLARAAKALLQNGVRRAKTKFQLGKIIVSLGKPGAAERAALAILSLR